MKIAFDSPRLHPEYPFGHLRRLSGLGAIALLGLLLGAGNLIAESPTSQTPALKRPAEGLLGYWRSESGDSGEAEALELRRDHLAVVSGGRLARIEPMIGQRGPALVTSRLGDRQSLPFSFDGEVLVLGITEMGKADPISRRYVKVAGKPEGLESSPMPLGNSKRPLPEGRLDAVTAEFQRRQARDQEVRQNVMGPKGPDPEALQRMQEVDADNLEFLLEQVEELGWIDAGRFGSQNAMAAFLIVQHSGHIPLMAAAVAVMEKEARSGAVPFQLYALLHDRLQLLLGKKQRYGSQIQTGPEGPFVAPLEDPQRVDERRGEVGMPPLATYLERFKARSDGGEIPIREEF